MTAEERVQVMTRLNSIAAELSAIVDEYGDAVLALADEMRMIRREVPA